MRQCYADRIVGRLRKEGLKITPQRVAILKYLDGNKAHPSVDEIHREVSRRFPSISLATVYNTLDTLERLGEVQTVSIDPSRKRFDPDASSHHHAMCDRCGVVRDVFADVAAGLRIPEELGRDFLVERARVSFGGLCRTCAPHAS